MPNHRTPRNLKVLKGTDRADRRPKNIDPRAAGVPDMPEGYHAVLSPGDSSGRDGTYQPLMTSFKKPALTRRSRCVRLRSRDRIAA
jgi:hypothetical protein